MVIAQFVIIIGIYTFILFRVPNLRLAGGIVAAALLGGLSYYILATDPEPRAEMRRIDVVDVTLSDVELEIGIRTSELSGRVINGSENYDLTGVLLTVKLFDCPGADSDLSDCYTIGEDDGEARVTVPPGQLRDFTASLLFIGLPEVTGEFRWTHEVTGLRALERRE